MYCKVCGKQVYEQLAFCPNCGARVDQAVCAQVARYSGTKRRRSTLANVAYAFMIIATIGYAFALIPLAWAIPMTVVFARKSKTGETVGVGFKVCTLLFVSLIAGILMLCDDDTP